MSRTDAERLADIADAIDRMERFRGAGLPAEVLRDVFVLGLIVIGEAVNALSSDVLAAAPEVPWRQIVRMRNRLTHAYFSIDMAVVDAVVVIDLPVLREAVERLRQS